MTFSESFFDETIAIVKAIDTATVEASARGLAAVRDRGGRLFILGVGGSAGHASHAVNDFRKLCGIEAYAPTDNVSELTARTNDEGWDTTFVEWLRCSRVNERDAVLVFSVGGGEPGEAGVGQPGARPGAGRGARHAGVRDRRAATVASPPRWRRPAWSSRPSYADRVTPHTEGLCAVVWHLLVSHPALAVNTTKWEGLR